MSKIRSLYQLGSNHWKLFSKSYSVFFINLFISQTSPPKIALLFPGQGSQHVGMGHDIYNEYAAAREVIDECEESLGARLRDVMRLRGEAMQNSVSQTATAMKALMVIGNHLEDIEELMPRLKRSLPRGEVAEIANVNSRSQIVLSGTENGVKYAASVFHSKGFAGRSLPLPVSAPFHCSLMAPAYEIMGPALDATDFKQPDVEVISNVTSRPFVDTKEIRTLLKRQILETVQWQRCLRYAKDDFVFDWVVVGPSKVLSNLVRKEFPHDTIRYYLIVTDGKVCYSFI
ncbi:hypothetical protein HDV02_003614 [Globomyces sp. JEL0801]|nr:hypothetical protein HDV02_003614 [Globomyces sp. JEL0801]